MNVISLFSSQLTRFFSFIFSLNLSLSKQIKTHIRVGSGFLGGFFLGLSGWGGFTGSGGAGGWGSSSGWNRCQQAHAFSDDVVNRFSVEFGENFVEFVGFDFGADGFEDFGDKVFAWGSAGLGGEEVGSDVFHLGFL